jgi:hypothetical protein
MADLSRERGRASTAGLAAPREGTKPRGARTFWKRYECAEGISCDEYVPSRTKSTAPLRRHGGLTPLCTVE